MVARRRFQRRPFPESLNCEILAFDLVATSADPFFIYRSILKGSGDLAYRVMIRVADSHMYL